MSHQQKKLLQLRKQPSTETTVEKIKMLHQKSTTNTKRSIKYIEK